MDNVTEAKQIWECEKCKGKRAYGSYPKPAAESRRAMLLCQGRCRDGHLRTHTWHNFKEMQHVHAKREASRRIATV